MEQPVTEQSNNITKNIDMASSLDIVKLLYESDRQIFGLEGLLNTSILSKLEHVVDAVVEHLQIAKSQEGHAAIVFSGCGTSGRLGFMTARTFNVLLSRYGCKQNVFEYLVAGHDEALFLSRELAEDDPHVGQRDLANITLGKTRVLYIGITCGLSAPYVAGQLDFCMDSLDRFKPVLIGFNPVEGARNAPIENWNKTFLQVASRLEKIEETNQGYIINPIVGAEPITGSTRMKSGSATKIIIDAVCMAAILRTFHNEQLTVSNLISMYKSVEELAFEQTASLAKLVDCTGQSLSADGHVYYVSSSSSLALCGLIDASECKPTYGADIDDVRGFLTGGFAALGNKEGDLSQVIAISTEYFENDVVPTLSPEDTVVTIALDDEIYSRSTIGLRAKKILLHFCSKCDHFLQDGDVMESTVVHRVTLSDSLMSFCRRSAVGHVTAVLFLQLACKLTCNTLTTGAHILKGKVFENYMIDVRVSNNKLYHRAISIIQKFGQCDYSTAVGCLLRCIYDNDAQPDDVTTSSPISSHIKQAAERKQIVPLAVLLARLDCTLQHGRQLLTDCPVVRQAIARCRQV